LPALVILWPAAVALCSLALVLGNVAFTPVRAVFGVPFVLAASGYALTLALFPPGRLPLVERCLFSAGLSIALAVLGGLLLNLTPWGLTAASEAVLLALVTLVCCGGVLLREQREERQGAEEPRSLGALPHISAAQGTLFGLAAAIAVFSVGVARFAAIHEDSSAFTQLWLQPAASGSVELGVHNEEGSAQRYMLEVRQGDNLLQPREEIDLQSGQTWQTLLSLPVQPSEIDQVTATLYRSPGDDQPYRQVTLK
jgi:uncharacterized membrane protein